MEGLIHISVNRSLRGLDEQSQQVAIRKERAPAGRCPRHFLFCPIVEIGLPVLHAWLAFCLSCFCFVFCAPLFLSMVYFVLGLCPSVYAGFCDNVPQ